MLFNISVLTIHKYINQKIVVGFGNKLVTVNIFKLL